MDKIKKHKFLFFGAILAMFFGLLAYGYFCSRQISYYISLIGSFGFLSSLFYAWKAVIIFGYPEKDKNLPEYANSWWVHQFWFNFVGSLAGWFLIILFVYALDEIGIKEVTLMHLVMLFFGLLGVTGLLPSLLAQVPNILHLLTKKYGEDYFKK